VAEHVLHECFEEFEVLIDKFMDLPYWILAPIVMLGVPAVSIGILRLCRPVVLRSRGEEHNSVFSDGFGAAGTLYAIIAGLLVFGVFETFDESTALTETEAAKLVSLYRNAAVFPQPESTKADSAIVAYTKSVIDDEWPALAEGRGSEKTSEALDRIFSVLGPMVPDDKWANQYDRAYDNLNEIVILRAERIDHSKSSLPQVYWILLWTGGLLIVVYLSLSYMENWRMHAVAVGLMSAMLGMVFALLLEASEPFQGDTAVSPEPFQRALVEMHAT
jgi:hypothetical protein